MSHEPIAGPHRDPGLQPERTTLAWRRTLLAYVAAGLIVLQAAPTMHGRRAFLLALAAAVVLAPPSWWLARRHAHRMFLNLGCEDARLRHGARIALIGAATVLLGLAGLGLVALTR